MPALSFSGEWLDKLLSCEKRQTTRGQTDRFKVCDVGHIYNQQRRRITDKPLRRLTSEGIDAMYERGYPSIPEFHQAKYHAHFLGKVEITEVCNIRPCELSSEELEAWAMADGFGSFAEARCWFEIRYGARWMRRWWTVIGWGGWLERYFEPGAV